MAVNCIRAALETKNHIEIETLVVPDEADLIKKSITNWTDDADAPKNLILTTGGTGFAVGK